ncbi:MAG: NAD(P)-dependent alcohol dehydrogenase [Marmoricola sp.]
METENQHRTSTRTASATMQAIVQDRYGDAGVLHLATIERPTVREHEVLVRVHAAGLARGDWHLMTGRPYLLRLAFGLRRPRNPVAGGDLAGTVVEVGPAVTRFDVGDEVFGFGRGTFAEYAVAREDKLAHKPANTTFEQAATLPVSGLTALGAVCDVGRVEAGQKVLVTGASGGVGGFAVQLAVAAGAEVTGVASTSRLDLVRSLGADHVLDRTREDFADGRDHYDLVIDLAGNPTISRLRHALAPTGTAVIVGGEEGGNFSGGLNRQLRALALSPLVRQRLTTSLCKEHFTGLERLKDLVEDGRVKPGIDRVYSLAEAPDAMRRLESGQVRGKVAITILADGPRR